MSKAGYPNLIDKKDYWKTRVEPKIELVEGWARHGLDDTQIATNLGITKTTLKKYMAMYPELSDAIDNGRNYAEVLVENALFKRAVGFEYKEVTRERVKVFEEDENGKMKWTGEWTVKKTKEVYRQVQPDTQAIIYWLEHRAPSRWKRVIDEGGEEPIEIVVRRKLPGPQEVEADED